MRACWHCPLALIVSRCAGEGSCTAGELLVVGYLRSLRRRCESEARAVLLSEGERRDMTLRWERAEGI